MQTILLHNAEMELHERLKRARKRKFNTAAAAAAYLRIPYGTLTGHEAGSRNPKDTELRKYARVYGVELPWLRYEIGPEIKGLGDAPSPSLTTDEEELILHYRQLPPEEAEAQRNWLRVRVGTPPPPPRRPTKKRR